MMHVKTERIEIQSEEICKTSEIRLVEKRTV